MLTLYGAGRSRWVRPLWMLRELDVPFQAVTVDRASGELSSAAFRAMNPLGKIPVLVDEAGPVCESGAILLYLGDKFPDRRLIPRPGTYARGVHDQWMFMIATELEPPVWRLHKQITRHDGSDEVAAMARRDFALAAAPLEARLTEHPHLSGAEFTAADIMLTHLLTWGVLQELLDGYPALRAYRDRLIVRPAFPAFLYE